MLPWNPDKGDSGTLRVLGVILFMAGMVGLLFPVVFPLEWLKLVFQSETLMLSADKIPTVSAVTAITGAVMLVGGMRR